MWRSGSARICGAGTWLALSLALSACQTARTPTGPTWPVAPCPARPTLSPGPVAVTLAPEGSEPTAAHALTDEDWGRLLPYLAGLRACAEERGRTLDAVNAARP